MERKKQHSTENGPTLNLQYQKLEDNYIKDTIEVNGPYDIEDVKIKRLTDGTIQLKGPTTKSHYFKNCKERFILNVSPQTLQAMSGAMQEIGEGYKPCSISFSFNQDFGYFWMRNGKPEPGRIEGGGFQSLFELFFDLDFLKILEADMGVGSVPPDLMTLAENRAKEQEKNLVPFPDEVLDRLESLLGVKIKGRGEE